MATSNIPYPYRAGEPSQMETQLAVLATDPARAGAAMQLLPGAAAIRQDLGQQAGDQAAREYALQVMTQQHTARNQDNDARLRALALSQPGMTEAATQTPGLSDLFQGMSPLGTGLVRAGTQGAFDAQNAKTTLERMQGFESGVKSGYTVPPDVARTQTGIPFNMQAPEQEKIAGMHIAAAAARQSADAAKLDKTQWAYEPNSAGTGYLWKATHIPFGQDAQVAAETAFRNAPENQTKIGKDSQGNTVITPPNVGAPIAGMVARKSGAPLGTYGGTPAQKMGAQIPPAQREVSAAPSGGASPPAATTNAPAAPSRLPAVTKANPPPNGDALLIQYINRQPVAERRALITEKQNGTLRYGQDAAGNKYIMRDGIPKVGPLPPE